MLLLTLSLFAIATHADCGWFLDDTTGEQLIYGFGYCFKNSENGVEESYMFDCHNETGLMVQYFFDDVGDCSGDPTSNDTDPTNQNWQCNNDAYCNCVSAEESDCQFIEFKQYTDTKCSSNTWSQSAYVVNQCLVTVDGGNSQKFDCKRDTLLRADYSGTTCSGGGDFEDRTPLPVDACIEWTCKGSANAYQYVAILPLLMLVAMIAYQ
mmetsp:Transcript_28458/g.44998  ORF Transcript_28458/g.44998 Transcript_28458/m.44998 type:complete len:209 (+) Transcript_28458:104-730(+)